MMDRYWTHRQFFHTGDEFFSAALRCIREAKHQIQIETYIFQMDALTKMLLQELKIAVERGCKVQLLVDGVGSYFWLESLAEACRRDRIDLRVWQPLPQGVSSFRRMLAPARFRFLRLLRTLNRRDHRKMVLCDGTIVFMGSMNWTHVHSEKIMGAAAWRDSGVRLQGSCVQELQRAFQLAWQSSRQGSVRRLLRIGLKDRLYNPRTSWVRLNQSRKDRRYLNRDLIRRLRTAKNRILIESGYFLPTRALTVALKKTAKRGVRVEIIVPGPSDVPVVQWAAAGLSISLLKAGVRLHEYQKTILHGKFWILDDWASIGSMNLNHRSVFHDLEVEATFTDRESVEGLTRQWEIDRDHCKVLDLKTLKSVGWPKRILQFIAFRLRYIL